MEGGTVTHHPPVEGVCPRCGAEVSDLSRRCRECLLQLVPGEGLAEGQTALLRRTWEREHPEATEAFDAWARSPDGPPPGVLNPVRPPEDERPLGPWEPLAPLVPPVLYVLAVIGVLDAATIAFGLLDLDLQILSALRLVAYVIAAVVWIRWFRRAYENVAALRSGVRRYSVGWAVWGWFVPIISVFRPKQIANDLWMSGDPKGRLSEPPGFLLGWWLLFLFGWSIDDALTGALASDPPSDAVTQLAVVSAVFDLLAARVVTNITRRLQERRDEVSPPGPAAAPPA